jgi:DNA polymerase-3 subunit epsilon
MKNNDMLRFAAIDFETANYGPESACAVAIVLVEGDTIVDRVSHLIQPPTDDFVFTYVHGLTWEHVSSAPTFAALWPELRDRLKGVDFVAAHNAKFDKGVLAGCLRHAGMRGVKQRYVCTVDVARTVWGIYPTKLPDVCKRLRIPLKHHDPGSDAEACARIVIAASKEGWTP